MDNQQGSLKLIEMSKENPRIAIGTVINNWTVLYYVKKTSEKNRHSGYVCQCVCGIVRLVNGYTLKSGKSKSCGYHTRKLFVERGTKPIYQAIIYLIYRNYETQAKERNYSFDLTLDQFEELIAQNCHYCGVIPSNTFKSEKSVFHGLDSFRYNGIDRMINSEGYTTENCVPCCQKCNFAKKNYNYDDWVKWVYTVYHNLKEQGTFNDYPKGVECKSMTLDKGSIQETG